MKIVTMYLPQFHRISENDAWWGEGFTEWVAVCNAKPLYEGHEQPKKPLDGNFYNLLDKKTMAWQVDLMQRYGIYGQCFYHYYFKDGRKILEKPAENLLKWRDINMPFCFCWANESWARSWSNLIDKNVWSSRGETAYEKENNPSGILLEQKYGGEKEWKIHYEYLRPFFQDARYIKIEGKPVFLIYKATHIPCLFPMIQYWEHLIKRDGFSGIYFIAVNAPDAKGVQAYLLQEPQYTLMNFYPRTQMEKNKKVRMYVEYEDIWQKIVNRAVDKRKNKIIQGGFTGYDDTPRRGTGGTVIGHATPEIFKEMFSKLLKKNADMGNEITFLNAWNEWGEGMYLEPDTRDGYAYLDGIQKALEQYIDEKSVAYVDMVSQVESKKLTERYRYYWRVLHQWMLLKEEGIRIADYLYCQGIRKVAIYGLGMLGLHLVKELEGSMVEIVLGIDQAAKEMQMVFPVVNPNEAIENVDVIIVTPVYAFDEIFCMLHKKYQGRIISLLELVTEIE